MTNPNLAIWDRVKKTDPQFTKSFDNGMFKGTSVDFNYNAQRATDLFGPYGIGWRVEIIKDEMVQMGDPEKPDTVHTMHVKIVYQHEGKEGEAIGIGHTPVSYQTRGYKDKPPRWVTDREYGKKTMTDAMSKAFSLMGFSVDIHLGFYDNTNYVNALRKKKEETPEPAPKSDNWTKPKEEPAKAHGIAVVVNGKSHPHKDPVAACKHLAGLFADAMDHATLKALWEPNTNMVSGLADTHADRLAQLYQEAVDRIADARKAA